MDRSQIGLAVDNSPNHTSDIKQQNGWLLWLRWVVVSSVGGAAGWFVSAVIGAGTFGLGLLAAGAITGGILSFAQGKIIASYVQRWNREAFLGAWFVSGWGGGGSGFIIVLITCFLFTFGPLSSIANLRLEGVLLWLLSYSIGSLVYAIIQLIVLSLYMKNIIWWLPMTIVGWTLGGGVGLIVTANIIYADSYPTGALSDQHFLAFFVNGALATLVAACVTGIGVAFRWHKHPIIREADSEDV